jgi:hypothetical protein
MTKRLLWKSAPRGCFPRINVSSHAKQGTPNHSTQPPRANGRATEGQSVLSGPAAPLPHLPLPGPRVLPQTASLVENAVVPAIVLPGCHGDYVNMRKCARGDKSPALTEAGGPHHAAERTIYTAAGVVTTRESKVVADPVPEPCTSNRSSYAPLSMSTDGGKSIQLAPGRSIADLRARASAPPEPQHPARLQFCSSRDQQSPRCPGGFSAPYSWPTRTSGVITFANGESSRGTPILRRTERYGAFRVPSVRSHRIRSLSSSLAAQATWVAATFKDMRVRGQQVLVSCQKQKPHQQAIRDRAQWVDPIPFGAKLTGASVHTDRVPRLQERHF